MDAMMGVSCWYDLGHVGLLDKNTTSAEDAPTPVKVPKNSSVALAEAILYNDRALLFLGGEFADRPAVVDAVDYSVFKNKDHLAVAVRALPSSVCLRGVVSVSGGGPGRMRTRGTTATSGEGMGVFDSVLTARVREYFDPLEDRSTCRRTGAGEEALLGHAEQF